MSSPNQLSFLPDDYLEQKKNRRTNLICAILFIIVMAGISSAFMISERRMRDIEHRHAEATRDYTDAARRIEQVQKMQDQQRKMAHQAELTASLLEKVPRSFLLAEVTNALPGGVSLLDMALESHLKSQPTPAPKSAFEQRTAGNAIPIDTRTEPRMYDVAMRLTGIADSDVQVAQLINRLSRSKLLLDVNLVISDRFDKQDAKLRKFQIEMKLNPDASVQRAFDTSTKTAAIELGEQP